MTLTQSYGQRIGKSRYLLEDFKTDLVLRHVVLAQTA